MFKLFKIIGGLSLLAAGSLIASECLALPPLIPHTYRRAHLQSPYYPMGTYYDDPNRYFYAPRIIYTRPINRFPRYYVGPKSVVPNIPAYLELKSPGQPERVENYTPAKITVKVPAGSQVFLQGKLMPPAGGTASRVYLTEPLEHGRNHYIVVRARWKLGSLPVEQTKMIDVRAGEEAEVDFLGPAPTKDIEMGSPGR